MEQSTNSSRVVVLDVSQQLEWFMQELSSCIETQRELPVEYIFICVLRFLHFSHNTREATGALLNELIAVYASDLDPTNKEDEKLIAKLDHACSFLTKEVHRQLVDTGLYDQDEQLMYTLGGWIQTHSPYLIRTQDINKFAKSMPLVVQSQYEIPSEFTDNFDNPGYWNPSKYLTSKSRY